MNSNLQAGKLCEVVVQQQDMSNATVRIAAWLIGAAKATGGFPIELSYRQIKDGFERGGVTVQGTGSRIETIKAAFEWLETRGYLSTAEGSSRGFGHHSQIYTLEL